MNGQYILMLGATSDICLAVAHEYAKKGYNFYLAGRKINELKQIAGDIKIRYNVDAKPVNFDVLDFDSHKEFYKFLDPKPSGVVCAIGMLGDQKQAEKDWEHCKAIMDSNYTGCVSILNIVASDFEARKDGFITGISSVAGDRGRASNYIYGSSKAAFTAYLSGLRNRLHASGVNVLTVKPGFVYTKMTEGLPLNKKLTAQPTEVAKDIVNAQQKKKDVIYTKWFWNPIMSIIKNIPEGIFKKLKL
jgi:decaprenylphospho-beta-D-erythro-pentofuranosid-2-ulose 2-reductase